MTDSKKVIYAIERCTCHVPDACRDCPYDAGHPYNECIEMLLKDALELLKEQETIVRCKDCKYAVLTYDKELKYCKYFVDEYGFSNGGDPLYLEADFFCKMGERR